MDLIIGTGAFVVLCVAIGVVIWTYVDDYVERENDKRDALERIADRIELED